MQGKGQHFKFFLRWRAKQNLVVIFHNSMA